VREPGSSGFGARPGAGGCWALGVVDLGILAGLLGGENLVFGGGVATAEPDKPDHLVLGSLLAALPGLLAVDEAAGHRDRTSLRQVLGARLRPRAERGDVDEKGTDVGPSLCLTAAMTGLRQGDLLGFRWRGADLTDRRVRVVSP
jgi:hypothetical protein